MGATPEELRIALDIVEHSPSVAIRTHREGQTWTTLFVTENVAGYGYDREDFLTDKISWPDMILPEDWDPLLRKLAYYEEKGIDKYTTYYRIMLPDAGAVWVADSSTVMRGPANQVLYVDHVIADHTQMVENQQRIRDHLQQQQVLNDILQALQGGPTEETFQVILARTGRQLGLSRVLLFEDSADHTRSHVVYEWDASGIPRLLNHGEYSVDYQQNLPEVAARLEAKGRCVLDDEDIPDGSRQELARRGIMASVMYAVYQGDRRYGFISFDDCEKPRRWPQDVQFFLRNISKLVDTALLRKGNEDSIRQMAYNDQLTGLTNRYRFDIYLEQAITQARIAQKNGYVLFIDLDDFKVINEGYGHDYGDALLIAVADYLAEFFGDISQVFRFGGDEFTLLVSHENGGRLMEIVDRLLQRARHPWMVMDREFYCTISIGIVRFPDSSMDATDVIKSADIAMYQAKRQGKNSYVLYNQDMNNDSLHRLETERRMRDAIENHFAGFEVYYQPIVNLAGEITGAEALVRWHDTNNNLIPPGEFVPLAEYLGLIVPLGDFVLRTAATECRRINEYLPDFTMSVNVSIRQFQQRDFLSRVEEALQSTRVDVSNMVLEVTEGMLVQNMERMQVMVEQLRDMGLSVAMDDFGTGYSSLNNMRQLPLDIIKIDRSFTRDLTQDDYAKSFIRLISDLTHSMERVVCVEGVETAAQYSYCAECRVDKIQGFYFYHPMPVKKLRELLQSKKEHCG